MEAASGVDLRRALWAGRLVALPPDPGRGLRLGRPRPDRGRRGHRRVGRRAARLHQLTGGGRARQLLPTRPDGQLRAGPPALGDGPGGLPPQQRAAPRAGDAPAVDRAPLLHPQPDRGEPGRPPLRRPPAAGTGGGPAARPQRAAALSPGGGRAGRLPPLGRRRGHRENVAPARAASSVRPGPVDEGDRDRPARNAAGHGCPGPATGAGAVAPPRAPARGLRRRSTPLLRRALAGAGVAAGR